MPTMFDFEFRSGDPLSLSFQLKDGAGANLIPPPGPVYPEEGERLDARWVLCQGPSYVPFYSAQPRRVNTQSSVLLVEISDHALQPAAGVWTHMLLLSIGGEEIVTHTGLVKVLPAPPM